MTELSPSAQTVLDAFLNGSICRPSNNVAFESDRNGLAAAFRAVADQIAPTKQNYSEASDLLAATCLNGMAYAANELRLIATELRNHQ
jgi:hypothetical protein